MWKIFEVWNKWCYQIGLLSYSHKKVLYKHSQLHLLLVVDWIQQDNGICETEDNPNQATDKNVSKQIIFLYTYL